MITRREINSALTLMLGVLFSEDFAPAASPQQNMQGHMQNTESISVQTLIKEPLAEMPNPEVTMVTLTVAPGSSSAAHKHTGPVFAYMLEGEIENQVDPNPPQKYKAGEFFYEAPMHVHRSLRNLSDTNPAKLLIVEIGEKGKPFTIGSK